jgi:hypothetical protein
LDLLGNGEIDGAHKHVLESLALGGSLRAEHLERFA